MSSYLSKNDPSAEKIFWKFTRFIRIKCWYVAGTPLMVAITIPTPNPLWTPVISDYHLSLWTPRFFTTVCLVTQLCPTLYDPWTVACQAPLSMGILQARILEWVAMSSFRGSSQPRDRTQVSRIAGRFFTSWVTREAPSSQLWGLVILQLLSSMGSFPTLCLENS